MNSVLSPSISTLHQDFADITSQPSLEAPADSGLEGDEKAQEESCESHFLSPAAIKTLVQVHQCLCLGYARSLWYQSTAPANHSKEHMKTLVSSYLIASPLISHFYHLIGQWLLFFFQFFRNISIRVEVLSSERVLTSVFLHQTLNWTSS